MTIKFATRILLTLLILPSLQVLASFSDTTTDENISKLNHTLLKHHTHPVIVAVVPESFPPFYFTDEEMLPYGMAIEVLNEIDHHAGYQTKYTVKSDWKEVFKTIDDGDAHIIPNLGITAERKKKYLFTTPYAKTDVNIITRKKFSIREQSKLHQLNTGVVKNNLGTKLAREIGLKQVISFDSIKDAYDALINKKIDALIYPRVIALRDAKKLNIMHSVQDTGITLKTIERAIAVHKDFPEIHIKLDNKLKEYIKSQTYSDTYSAWYGAPPGGVATSTLIIIDLIVFIFSVTFFYAFWHKKRASFINRDDNSKKDIIWLITLISILVITILTVTTITLSILYNTAFDEQRQRLIDTTKSRARLIEAVARYDLAEYMQRNTQSGPSAYDRTISQITSAHSKFRGLGDTGEFLLAKFDDNKKEIQYILQQRHSQLNKPSHIAIDSGLGVPMRLALLGHSGTIVAPDYRGKDVLAAYEPLKVLDLGMVTKLDIDEIRKPFIDSGLIILAIVLLLTSLESYLFFKIMAPVINRLIYTEQRFHHLFKNSQTPALLVNPKNGRIIDANEAASRFYGYTLAELNSYNLSIFYPDDKGKMNQELQKPLHGSNQLYVTRHRLQNGELRDIEALTSAVEFGDETVVSLFITDITEKLELERVHLQFQHDLAQAKKMEALGQLTGGIAHDFNNMLGVIMGYTGLSLEQVKKSSFDKLEEYLNQVLTASGRAKDLISSMMIFSRSSESKNRALEISSLVKEDIKMMRSIIPSTIEMISHINDELPAVIIEPVKLQQLIMNICINARDAMDGKGELTISLQWHKNVNDNCLVCYEKITGDWIELSIQDTGTGMTKETIQHIFEPFYTTKELGKGTGMGMSVVHGIAIELDAHITVDSTPGSGSKFSVLFKPVYGQNQTQSTKQSDNNFNAETENTNKHILIVDDEPSISGLLKSILETQGYQCKNFSSSRHALKYFSDHPEEFNLIISDQTMPELTGFQLITEIRKIRQNIAAIISTGYSENFNESIASKNNIIFLPKPVGTELLLNTVYKALHTSS